MISMGSKFDKAAGDLLNSPQAAALSGKKDELQGIISSAEGQKVKKMMEGKTDSLMTAFENGDMKTLQSGLSSILSTKEGAQLAEKLMEMMK